MSDFLFYEFKSIYCGKLLGTGISREVYENRLDPSTVIKIETKGGYFQNVREWEAWADFGFSKEGKWLAPCVQISSSGAILIQKRAFDLHAHQRPAMLPAFLSDIKPDNFGVYNKRIVCRDYGYLCTNSRTMTMKKANWKNYFLPIGKIPLDHTG